MAKASDTQGIKFYPIIINGITIFAAALILLTYLSNPAKAQPLIDTIAATDAGTAPGSCVEPGSCSYNCPLVFAQNRINSYTTSRVNDHKSWVQNTLWPAILEDLQVLTDQLAGVSPAAMSSLGMITDGAQTQTTQRRLQKLKAESVNRNRPNLKMCSVATMTKGLTNSEDNGRVFSASLSNNMKTRFLGGENTQGADGVDSDKRARWNMFVSQYCDPDSENGALGEQCQNIDPANFDKDVDFARLVGGADTIAAEDTHAVTLMASYLYGHDIPRNRFKGNSIDPKKNSRNYELYEQMRSIMAMRSIAANSFQSVVALKSEGPEETEEEKSRRQSTMIEMGYSSDFIANSMKASPSYVGRMNLMQDALFHNPGFYIDNISSPEHVSQTMTAMKAIENMYMDRLAESLKRQELLNSVWLELKLRKEQSDITRKALNANLEGERLAE